MRTRELLELATEAAQNLGVAAEAQAAYNEVDRDPQKFFHEAVEAFAEVVSLHFYGGEIRFRRYTKPFTSNSPLNEDGTCNMCWDSDRRFDFEVWKSNPIHQCTINVHCGYYGMGDYWRAYDDPDKASITNLSHFSPKASFSPWHRVNRDSHWIELNEEQVSRCFQWRDEYLKQGGKTGTVVVSRKDDGTVIAQLGGQAIVLRDHTHRDEQGSPQPCEKSKTERVA